jgi:hypothetical protein
MTGFKFLIYLILLSQLLISCQTPQISGDEKKKIAAEVKRTLVEYYNDIRDSGLSAEFKYLDSSEDFFWVPPGYNTAISYDSVAVAIKRAARSLKSLDNRFDTLSIFVLSDEYATYTCRLRSIVNDTAGKRDTFFMVETGLMVKRKNDWKLLQGQTSIVN